MDHPKIAVDEELPQVSHEIFGVLCVVLNKVMDREAGSLSRCEHDGRKLDEASLNLVDDTCEHCRTLLILMEISHWFGEVLQLCADHVAAARATHGQEINHRQYSFVRVS